MHRCMLAALACSDSGDRRLFVEVQNVRRKDDKPRFGFTHTSVGTRRREVAFLSAKIHHQLTGHEHGGTVHLCFGPAKWRTDLRLYDDKSRPLDGRVNTQEPLGSNFQFDITPMIDMIAEAVVPDDSVDTRIPSNYTEIIRFTELLRSSLCIDMV